MGLSLFLSLRPALSCLRSLSLTFVPPPPSLRSKNIQWKKKTPPHSVDNDDDNNSSSGDEDGSCRASKLHRAPSFDDGGGGNTSDGGGSNAPPPDWKEKRSKKNKEDKKGKKRIDLYELLGLQHVRWTATEKQIRDAYKRAALEHHPDKVASAARQRENDAAAAAAAEGEEAGGNGEESGFDQDAAEAKFKLVQEAYETLSDPARRREFDSTDWFDDSLPTECGEEEGAFYSTFGPAFKRNARWSAAPGGADAVPELGDADTPWEKVDKFYDFWFAFKSWREFPHEDEEDVEGAESREEKRWLERHNAKLREAGKKEERKRLRAFVELSYERDPRVAARKEQMKSARAARAAEKAAARNAGAKAKEEARAKVEADAAAAAAEAAAAAKKQREREKKAAQKARSRLRAAAAAAGAKPGSAIDEEVESLCAALDAASLDKLTEAIAAGGPSSLEGAVAAAAGRVSADKDADKEARDAARRQAEAAAAAASAAEAEAKARAWTDEEVRLLTRAVGKLPAGTPKRWEAVAAQVRTRTADECVAMVKHGLAAGKFSAAAAGGSFTVPAKRAGNVVIKDAATSRETSFTDVEVKLVGEAAEALAPAAAAAAKAAAKAAAAPPPPPSNGASPAAEAAAKAAADAPSSSPPPVSPAAPVDVDAPAWTEGQELALVRALKAFGKELGPGRWARVSEAVPGQSAAACLRRFKELKAAVKSTKKEG